MRLARAALRFGAAKSRLSTRSSCVSYSPLVRWPISPLDNLRVEIDAGLLSRPPSSTTTRADGCFPLVRRAPSKAPTEPELSALQRQVLDLLDVPEAAYLSPPPSSP